MPSLSTSVPHASCIYIRVGTNGQPIYTHTTCVSDGRSFLRVNFVFNEHFFLLLFFFPLRVREAHLGCRIEWATIIFLRTWIS